MQKPIALVLGGGGGKGAYQIGAWKALREYGIDKRIGAVAGTSVGALNTALFIQGDYEGARKVWELVDNDKILCLDKSRYLQALKKFQLPRIFSDGIFSSQGLLELMNTQVDLEKISRAKTPAFATCSRLPTINLKNFKLPELHPSYFRINGLPPEVLTSVLLASSAIPLVFDSVEINGSHYVDGGLTDNLPLSPLYDLGFRQFIVINLDMYLRLPREQYRDADIIEVMPDHTRTETLTGVLDFSPNAVQAHIDNGYKDTFLTLSSRFRLPGKNRFFGRLRELLPDKKTSEE